MAKKFGYFCVCVCGGGGVEYSENQTIIFLLFKFLSCVVGGLGPLFRKKSSKLLIFLDIFTY